MIFNITEEKTINILRPFLRFGDYLVFQRNGNKDIKVVTYSGFAPVDYPDEETILNKAVSDRDVTMSFMTGGNLRFLLLSHPSNSFYIDSSGNLFFPSGRLYGNIKQKGIPSQEAVEEEISEELFSYKALPEEEKDLSCSFCEFYPICGGHFKGRCESYKEKLKDIKREILRIRLNRSATVFVGFTCVNNCIFCAPADKRKERPLKKEEIIRFIDNAAENGCSSISFSGAGEPTLNPDLLEYVSFAKKKGINDIIVFTNGYNLTPELLESLLFEGCRGFLVSLHGNKESHDLNVRRKGSYEEAIRAIRLITDRQVDLSVNTCITKNNIGHLSEVLDIVREINPNARHSLSFPEISGNAILNIDHIPGLQEAGKVINDLYRKGYTFLVEGIPLCFIKGFPRKMVINSPVDLYKDNLGERYSPNNRYLEACYKFNCSEREICAGINKGYLTVKGKQSVEEEISQCFKG